MRVASTFSSAILLALFITGSDVRAQACDETQAESLFREGRALMTQRKFEAARGKLEESYGICAAAGTAINLGDCFEQLGQIASALISYQKAQNLLAPNDPRTAPVREQIAVLEKKVPHLTIQLTSGTPRDVSIALDGSKTEPGTRVPVNPGEHVIVVTVEAREPSRHTITLAEGESKAITVEAGKPIEKPRAKAPERVAHQPVTPAPTAQPRTGDSSYPQTLGYVLGGVGVVALGTGIVTGLMANQKMSVVESNCDTTTKRCRSSEGTDAAESGQTLKTASLIGWGVGIAGLAAGGYFLFFAGPSDNEAATLGSRGTGGSWNGRVLVGGRF